MTTGWTEWTDGAVQLLRRAPARVWLLWIWTTPPLALLFGRFLIEAFHSPYFLEQSGLWSLAMALLLWGKHIGDALFARRLYAALGGAPPPFGLRDIAILGALTPTAFFLLPLAAAVMLPLAPAVSFYRLLAIVPSPRRALRLAARDWMAQSWELSAILIAGLLLWANLLAIWLAFPSLMRSLFGIETQLGLLGNRLINGTSLTVVSLVAWTLLDPLLTASAVRRAFADDARESGADLLASLRRLAAPVAAALLLVLALALPARAQELPTQEPPTQAPEAAAPSDVQRLEQQVAQTLRDSRYAFRLPKAETAARPPNALERAFEWMGKQMDAFINWLRSLRKDEKRPSPGPRGWGKLDGRTASILVAITVAIGTAIFLLLARRKVTQTSPRAVAPELPAVPDLRREDLSPDALPEEEWLAMADSLAAQGELRLAMRALHLAGLRRLGARGLVTLAASKSGGEYRGEVERRSRQQPAILDGFDAARRRFEAAWYGFTAPTLADWEDVRGAWQGVRAHVG